MTAAYRLKGLGWFGGCVVVTLGFYLVSLQVAAERKRLDQVDAKIHSAERDVRALETEFDTRANLAQLERWNGDTLALVAPTAGQFVRNEAQLASISFNGGGAQAGIQTAALIVPAFTAQTVTPTTAATVPAATVEAAKVAANDPSVRPAVTTAAPVAKSTVDTVMASIARPAIRKTQAVAMLDRGLLSDSTIGDLLSGARSETGRLR